MPTYTMIHKDTGETQQFFLTISERDEWLEKNLDWTQSLSIPLIVREAKGALALSPDSWKDVLKSMKKGAGKNNNIHV